MVAVLLIEGVALLRLRRNETIFANYWQNVNSNADFVYIALGDSAAQGIGASKPEYGYVGSLAEDIAKATGTSVQVVNLSVPGAKIQDVINSQLSALDDYRPDLITVEIGSNNIRHFDEAAFKTDFDELARRLPKGAYVANIPHSGGVYKNNTEAVLASRIVADAVQSNGLLLVDLQTETTHHRSIRNYAADYFHPNNRAYRIWRDAFWRQIEIEVYPGGNEQISTTSNAWGPLRLL